MSVFSNTAQISTGAENVSERTRRQVFEETVMPHFAAAYNLARWLTRNTSDADDVVQEAYLRAYKFFGGFKGGDGKAWVLRIVRNTCYTWLHANRSPELVYELDEGLFESAGPDPETQLIEYSERQWLRMEINALPSTFREVLVLRDIEELSYKEIAAIIDCPIGTVMSRLARGRAHLQKRIQVCAAGDRR